MPPDAYQEASAAAQILASVLAGETEAATPVEPVDSGTSADWPKAAPPPHPKFGYRVTGPHGRNAVMSWYWRGVMRETGRGAWAFGTFWPYRGGYVSAGHVFEEMQGQVPPFASTPVYSRAGTITDSEGKKIDAVFYGVDLSGDAPPPARPSRGLTRL